MTVRGKGFARALGGALAIGGGILASLLGAALLAAWTVLGSADGRVWLVRMVAESVSRPGGPSLDLGTLEPGLPTHVGLGPVRVGDADGVWLEIESLRLDWAPMDLLWRRRIHVERLAIDAPRLHRLPAATDGAAPPAEAEAGGLVVPPIGLRLDILRVENGRLGAPVIGEAVGFRIEGGLDADPAGAATLALLAERTDDSAARIRGDVRLDPDQRTLSLNLAASDSSGGLLATLLGVPERPGWSLDLAGDGPLSDWRGTVSGRLGEAVGLDLSVAARIADTLALTVDGTLRASALAPPDLRPLLGDPATLHLSAGAMPDGRDATIETSLATAAARLDVRAALPDPDGDLAAGATLRLIDPDALAQLAGGLRVEEAVARVTAAGPLDSARLKVEASANTAAIGDLEAGGIALIAKAVPETDWNDPAAVVNLDAEARIEAFGGDVLADVDSVAGGPATLTLGGRAQMAGSRLRIDRMVLATPLVRATGDGAYHWESGDLDAAADLRVPDLAPLRDLTGVPLRGRLDGDVVAVLAGDDGLVEARVTGRDLSTGDPRLDGLLGDGVAARATLYLEPSGAIRLAPLTAAAGPLKATADVVVTNRLDGSYRLRVGDLSPLSGLAGRPLSGALALNGTLAGPVADPATAIALEGRDLGAGDILVPRLSLRSRAGNLASQPRGDLDLDADTPVGPLRLALGFTVDPGRSARLAGLDLRLPGARADGDLSADFASGLATGDLRLDAPDLSRLGRLLGLDLAGRLTGQVGAAPDAARQGLTLALRADGIVAEGTRIEAAEARGRAILEPDGLALDGRVEASDIAVGGVTLSTASLNAEGNPDSLAWRVSTRGVLAGPFALSAAGRLRQGKTGSTVALDSLDGDLAGHPLRLTAPTAVTLANGAATLEPLSLSVGKGRLNARAALNGDTLSVDATAEALPLAVSRLAMEEGSLGGHVDLSAEVDLTPGDDRAALRLTGRGVVLEKAGAAATPPLDLDGTAGLSNGTLTATLKAAGPFEQPAMAAATLRMGRPAGGGWPLPDMSGPLSGTLAWTGDLAEIEPLIPVAGHLMSGPLAVDIRVAGTPGDPRPSGSATLRGGTYENVLLGTRLTALDADILATADHRLEARVAANDAASGRMAATARVAMRDGAAPEVAADAELTGFRLIRRDEVDAVGTGRLTATLGGDGGRVAGRVVLEPVEIRLLNTLPASVTTLDVVDANTAPDGPEPDGPEPDRDETSSGPIELDVEVEIPRRAFIRGRGLDSEWKGLVAVTGTADDPLVNGSMEAVRGQLSALGKLFRIAKGVVTLDGARPPDPLLDFTATTRAESLAIDFNVAGRASKPEIGVSSDPPLPEDEVLSRLLFGKAFGQLGPGEALALAEAAATLGGGGGGMVDRVRAATGLDVLRTGSDDGGASRLTAGKYVSDGVYVGVNQGMETGSGSVTVEVDVTESISVESEVGANSTGNLGVNWKLDY